MSKPKVVTYPTRDEIVKHPSYIRKMNDNHKIIFDPKWRKEYTISIFCTLNYNDVFFWRFNYYPSKDENNPIFEITCKIDDPILDYIIKNDGIHLKTLDSIEYRYDYMISLILKQNDKLTIEKIPGFVFTGCSENKVIKDEKLVTLIDFNNKLNMSTLKDLYLVYEKTKDILDEKPISHESKDKIRLPELSQLTDHSDKNELFF